MQFKDQLNNVFELHKTPTRIVSLVPSITELLVALGLEKNLVGVTKFCVHPTHLRKDKTVVGGTKNCKIDKISALNPDIILCNKEENTKEIVTFCKEIAPTYVSDIYTIADTLQVIHDFGKLFSCDENAKEIIDIILKKHIDFLEFIKQKKQIKVAYFIWKNPWMAAANNTFIHHLLDINNYENVFADKTRYPEIDILELAETKELDCIFLSSEPYPFKEKDIAELQKQFKKTKIILVDGEYFSWYGSRLIDAFTYFKNLRNSLTSK